MSRITNKGAVAPLALFQTTTDASAETYTGQRFDLSDGREVVFVQAGAVALVADNLIQSSAIVANHQNIAVTTAAAGATQITVTLGATAATANQYQGGFVAINAGTGIGQTLKISSHPAANASATLVLTLEDALVAAVATADSKAVLIANPYDAVIVNPTTATGTPVGVAFYPIAASAYGYLISKGPVGALSDASVAAVGLGIMPSTTTAGTITVGTATGARIGRALQTGVSAEARVVYVDL